MIYLKEYYEYKTLPFNFYLEYEDVFAKLKIKKIENFYSILGNSEEEKNKEDLFKNKELEKISDDTDFINLLTKNALKKSQIIDLSDYETFIKGELKLMFIYNIDYNELQDPKYLILQSRDNESYPWKDVEFYQFNDSIKKFYDMITIKVIKIIDDNKEYTYKTSNVNEWLLENSEDQTQRFKKILKKEEIESIINDNRLKVDIN